MVLESIREKTLLEYPFDPPEYIRLTDQYINGLTGIIPLDEIKLNDIKNYCDGYSGMYEKAYGIKRKYFKELILPILREEIKRFVRSDYLEAIKKLRQSLDKYQSGLMDRPASLYFKNNGTCEEYIKECDSIIQENSKKTI